MCLELALSVIFAFDPLQNIAIVQNCGKKYLLEYLFHIK